MTLGVPKGSAPGDRPRERGFRRVCVLTSVHSALDTRVFHKQARTLASAGYDVLLVAQHAGDTCQDGVRIAALPEGVPRWQRPVQWWRLLLKALRSRADVYHIHDPELIPLALLLQGLTRRPAIYDAHEYYGDEVRTRLWIPAPLRNLCGRLTEQLEKAAARRLGAVVTVNEHMTARFLRVQPRSVTIHNYPPAEYFGEAPSGERERLVVYAGVLTRDRGIETIYETGRLLRARFAGLTIAIAGSLDWAGVSPTIPREEAAWQRDAGVRFLGLLPQREIPGLLARAAAGWVPFLPTPNNIRSTPNKLLEYMAAALPVVASDFGYLRAIVSGAGCGLLACPADAASQAAQIAWLLDHPHEARAMGERGRRAVLDRYTWATEGEKLVRLYDELRGVSPATGAAGNARSDRYLPSSR